MDPFQFEEGISANGLPVYAKHLPWIEGWVQVRVIIRVGARHDPTGKEGLAHFFEHLPLEGSSRFPDSKAIREINNTVFLYSLNATTSFESTVFEGMVRKAAEGQGSPTGNLTEAMRVFHDLVFHPLLEREVEREREVVVREIWEKVGSKKVAEVLKLACREVYHDHPMGRMARAVGWEETVRAITQGDLIDFHRAHYHLGNIALLFVGDISLTEALEMADLFAEGAPKGRLNSLPQRLTWWPEPLQAERNISIQEWTGSSALLQYTDITMSRVVPKQGNPSVLGILRSMLKRLYFEEIREKLNAAYQIVVDCAEYTDHHLFTVHTKVAPEKADEVRAILGEVSTIAVNPQRYADLFEERKSYLLRAADFWDRTADNIADVAAGDVVSEGRVVSYEEIRMNRTAIAYDDIQRLTAREFSPRQLHWFVLRP